jgi:oligopeptide/dipeptide ABC transporter ATP-binding protein
VEIGPVEQIWQHPRHPYTQQLLAAVPTIAKALSGATTADLLATPRTESARPRHQEDTDVPAAP